MTKYELCVIATRYKLADMIASHIRKVSEAQILSPYRDDKRSADKLARMTARALPNATFQAGAYLAHARLEFSLDDIEHILRDAGGQIDDEKALRHHLSIWRYNGGMDDKQTTIPGVQ